MTSATDHSISPAALPSLRAVATPDLQPTLASDQIHAYVDELRERVATRIAHDEVLDGMDPGERPMRHRNLFHEELEAWSQTRARRGEVPLSEAEEDSIEQAVIAALSGLGPLEAILGRDDVEDIFFNGSNPTVLRLADGRKVEGPALGETDERVRQLVASLASSQEDGSGRELSQSKPLLAVRLPAVGYMGARLSAAIDVTPSPVGTIRVHRHVDITLEDLREQGTIDSGLHALLTAAVLGSAKVLVCGPPGAGKTTLLRALCGVIPPDQAIVTVEDNRELGLHVMPRRETTGQIVRDRNGRPVPLRPPALVKAYESRPANSEGMGAITMSDNLHQSLRDSPDRTIVGETRGPDVTVMIDAISNGVPGVMATIHADSAKGIFDRVVQMVRAVHPPLPADYALRGLAYFDLVIFMSRDRLNRRFVSEVIAFDGINRSLGDNGLPPFEVLYQPGQDGRGRPTGRPTGRFLERLVAAGWSPEWMNPQNCDWPEWEEGQ
ncbi:Flp pilus assembly complex ATPase component TadA [Janibacter melonis]|uniref:CpaF family protein n=1 Tax=Janibacter melonis TaxID=262209 RepID=UPI002043C9F1|nr:ATPase, T2SS/T4P/T4SS family [Janibacter melonis]MCM3555909.1 Flp pilus assembly complex ATPase component TadA [Janibacter melonis]